MMNLREACPSKAVSLPEQKQVQKQRQEIILGVARQSLKQKATNMSFISCVRFRAILQWHEIRLSLFWALWPCFLERWNLFSLNSRLRTEHQMPLSLLVLQCCKVEWFSLPLLVWWMTGLRHFLKCGPGLVTIRAKWKPYKGAFKIRSLMLETPMLL